MALLRFEVDPEKCRKCGLCAKACRSGAIEWRKGEVAFIDKEKCIPCRLCISSCPHSAVYQTCSIAQARPSPRLRPMIGRQLHGERFTSHCACRLFFTKRSA